MKQLIFKLIVEEADEQFWEARVKHSRGYFVCYADTQKLAIRKALTFLCKEYGCTGSVPGAASGAAVHDLQHASALHTESNGQRTLSG